MLFSRKCGSLGAAWSWLSLLPHHVNAEVVTASVIKAIANLGLRDVPKTIWRIRVKLGTESSSLSQAVSVLTQGQETIISAMQANEGTSKG